MTRTQHTPGPLTIHGPSDGKMRGLDDGGDYAILDADGHIIGEAIRRVGPNEYAAAEANARLWAAAPRIADEHARMKAMLHEALGDTVDPRAFNPRVRALLAEIEGER
mgnify:CR=1 FL=1